MAPEFKRRQRAEAETREAQAALAVEAERRRADQAQVASLEKEMDCMPLVMSGNGLLIFERGADERFMLGRRVSLASFSKRSLVYKYAAQPDGEGDGRMNSHSKTRYTRCLFFYVVVY